MFGFGGGLLTVFRGGLDRVVGGARGLRIGIITGGGGGGGRRWGFGGWFFRRSSLRVWSHWKDGSKLSEAEIGDDMVLDGPKYGL